ncbi:hypothetical protein J1G44_08980 [Cellulomonas sp. zg-ZUI199]|uniref:Alkaline shock response membrane anchor protein AmaP n=1 Tax=Cellulomonas wangleii TaxID=2816956 RepID=A0ABX8D559_9CELL|nr:DUF6286 domain-containing protein [Cellulomonas wangleii]MBO0924616.1 hypothetical protein [Cellulomonas wangleii]QVI62593.1 hypothetical protein KG103_01160 [Cellulomonas wangleii]
MSATADSRRARARRRAEDPAPTSWPPVTEVPAAAAPDPVPLAAPRPAGAVAWVGVVLALVALGLAVVLMHDGLVALRVLDGGSWVLSAADAVGDIRPTWEVALIGVLVGLVGLRLVVIALRRRRRPGLPLAAGGGQYLLGQDVARLASGAAAQVDGVLEVTSTWGRRAVTVRATTDGGPGLEGLIRAAVSERLSALAKAPRVVVRTRRSTDPGGVR